LTNRLRPRGGLARFLSGGAALIPGSDSIRVQRESDRACAAFSRLLIDGEVGLSGASNGTRVLSSTFGGGGGSDWEDVTDTDLGFVVFEHCGDSKSAPGGLYESGQGRKVQIASTLHTRHLGLADLELY